MQPVIIPRFGRLTIWLLLLLTGLVVLFLWSLHRGYDITDEGFYLLSYNYPAEYSSSWSSFYLLISKVLPPSLVSVVGYRVAALVCVLLAAAVFGLAFHRWCIARVGSQAAPALTWVICLFAIGSLLQFAILPRTIHYNNLNSLAIAVFSASILYYPIVRNTQAMLWLMVGGFAIALDGFVKASSAMAVAASGGLVLLLMLTAVGGERPRNLWRPVLALILGAVTGVVLFGLVIKPLPLWFADLRHETAVLMKTTYGISLLTRYLTDAYPIIRTLVYPFGIVATLASAWLYYQMRKPKWHAWTFLLLLVALLLLVFESYRTSLYKNSHLNYNRSAVWPLGALLVGVAMLATAHWCSNRPMAQLAGKWRGWVVPLWLFFLPFASSIGTWNHLFINVLLAVMYWLAILFIICQKMPGDVRHLAGIRTILLFCPAVVLTQQTFYGIIWGPYLQAENMLSQRVPLRVGAPFKEAELLVDAPTAQYLQAVRTAVRGAGFRTGDPILAIYDAPGIVYALGGIAPGNAWYFGQQDTRNCDALAKSRRDLSRAFLFINEPPGPDMLACMSDHGLRFPVGFRLIYKGTSPYSRNQYKWRSYQDTVRVYAPVALAPVANAE